MKPNKSQRLESRQEVNRLKATAKKNRKHHKAEADTNITYTSETGSIINFKTRFEFISYKNKMRNNQSSDLNLMKGKILYPTAHSEFEIQAYLYSEIKAMGVDIRGEVRAMNTSKRYNILDLVIYQDKNPVTIIEVKKDRTKQIREQQIEYGNYKLPIRFIMGMESAEMYINKVRRKLA